MLYISRKLPGKKYGVVDTDDDTEAIVTERELLVYCGNLDMNIKGVAIRRFSNVTAIESVRVIQDPNMASRSQVKAKTLLGVDMAIRHGEIVALQMNYDLASEKTVLRLSDFAPKLSGSAPIGWKFPKFKELCLIFDDKLTVLGEIQEISPLGVQYDIREFSDDTVVGSMYRAMLRSTAFDYKMFSAVLLDRPERHRFWVYVGLVDDIGGEPDDDYVEGLKTAKDRVSISERVALYYKDEFEKIVGNTAKLYLGRERVPGMLQDLGLTDWSLLIGCTDYEVLRRSFIGVFPFLRYCSVYDSHKVTRFWNFMRFFHIPDWVKSLYITLCQNTIISIRDYLSEE